MNICYITRDNGACAYYRLILPMDTAAKNGHKTYKIEKGDNAEYIEEGITNCDVLVIARPVEPMMHRLIEMAQELGKKVVIDFDDDLWNVSPFSSHYAEWGLSEVILDTPTGKMDLWVDGKNIDLKTNQAKADCVAKACEMADLVTVTQPELAKVYSQYGKVACLPNCVNMGLWEKLALKRNPDEVRLYWSGGSSHFDDWTLLKDVLPVIMQKYANVKLVLMGMKFDGTLKNCPQDRIDFHPWVPTPAYPYKTSILDPDICIIPLVDNTFNRGKSNIKWVEQGAMGVPCVTSAVTPYIEAYNGRNGVFVANDTESWIAGISHLIDNPMERWQMGMEATRTVKANNDISTQWRQWIDTYQELLNGD